MKAARRQVAGICAAEDGEERFPLQEQVQAGAGDQRPCHGPIARAGPYRFEFCPHRSAAAVHDQVALPRVSHLVRGARRSTGSQLDGHGVDDLLGRLERYEVRAHFQGLSLVSGDYLTCREPSMGSERSS